MPYSPLRQARLDAGLCIQCGSEREGPGIQAHLCARCADAMREAKRRFRDKHRDDPDARAKNAEYARRTRENYRSAGKCPRCGHLLLPADRCPEAYATCASCRAELCALGTVSRQRRRNVEAGYPADTNTPWPVGVHPARLPGGGAPFSFHIDLPVMEALSVLRRQRRDAQRAAGKVVQVRDLSQIVRECIYRWQARDCPMRRYTYFSRVHLIVNLDGPCREILARQANTIRFKGNRADALRSMIFYSVNPIFVCAPGRPREHGRPPNTPYGSLWQ
jgi:hypothetical protein